MKQFNITLTENELMTIRIALTSAQFETECKVDRLVEHNETGINTGRINGYRVLAKEYDDLFNKLFDIEYNA